MLLISLTDSEDEDSTGNEEGKEYCIQRSCQDRCGGELRPPPPPPPQDYFSDDNGTLYVRHDNGSLSVMNIYSSDRLKS